MRNGSPKDKENVKVAVLKVVRIKSRSRMLEFLQYWVAVAAGKYDGMIGVETFFSTNEKTATKGVEKSNGAIEANKPTERPHSSPLRSELVECVSLSEAPKNFGIVGSGMTRKLLNMAGITDCFVTSSPRTCSL